MLKNVKERKLLGVLKADGKRVYIISIFTQIVYNHKWLLKKNKNLPTFLGNFSILFRIYH